MIKKLFNKYFEPTFWIVALICLAFTNPADQGHFSLCPLKAVGVKWCPGCGLGHSIAYLFHGDIKSAFSAHWLGIPVVIALLYRVCTLLLLRPQYVFRKD